MLYFGPNSQAQSERAQMDRRTALGYVAAAAGAGLAAGAGRAASAATATPHAGDSSVRTTALAHSHRASFIERTDGTALFYRDWGAGKPLVFVASAGLDSAMWAYQMVPLVQAGYRCVAFDRRGHGRSSDPGRGYDFDTLADDLAAVIETLDLRGVTLVGHSMGCGEIVRYLTRHGSARVARVALLAPTTPFLLKTADNPHGIDQAVFEKLRATWLNDYPRWLAENSRPFVVPETSEQIVQWAMEMMLQTSLQAVVECNVAVTETDFRSELPRIDRPVLIVHGTADRSAPIELTGRPTAALLPYRELQVYLGAPHGLFLTHIERLNADLLRFVRS
jgi:non-heme chloroperoxidase